jgi:AraC family transcriptional regulator
VTGAKAGPSTSTQHWARIGQARAFIRAYAGEPLTLERIAGAAAVSPFHFARLFRALTGETIFQYVTRVRLKAAVRTLLERPDVPVTTIATSIGYDTAPSFNKAFKKTTRPEFRERAPHRFLFVGRRGVCPEEAPRAWADFHRLVAGARLLGPDVEFIGASYDDTGKVAENPHRYEAGVTVSDETHAVPGLSIGTLPGGRYAVFTYRGPYARLGRAFDALFSGWVVESGATFRSAPCLEIYLNDPRTVPHDELLTELCIPVA